MEIKQYLVRYIHKDNKDIPEDGIMTIKYIDDSLIAYFLCPCGCGNLLGVNNLGWSIDVSGELLPTINPSIKVINKCGSHFYIKDGKVILV